jgi:aspartate ammonia-lyase
MRHVSDEELEHLATHARVLGYLPDAYVFHEGQPRRFFGVVMRGRIELRTGPRARPRVLHVLGPGESFGEVSLFDDYPHSASAVVLESAEVLEIDHEAFDRIARDRPDLYTRLVSGAIGTIASRLGTAARGGLGGMYASGAVRREKDLLGERDVLDTRYFGIQTLRAAENFQVTGIRIAQHAHLLGALAAIKEAAAAVNLELGLLEERVADAIMLRAKSGPVTCTPSSSST